MSQAPNIDGVLIQWGDRLFYPGNRIVKASPQPKLSGGAAYERAAAIRERIAATVLRRAPQVMVKVTGGGRGMRAIAAHFRYISKNGRLDIENERGELMSGKDTLHELADDWRFGGSLIAGKPGAFVAIDGERRRRFERDSGGGWQEVSDAQADVQGQGVSAKDWRLRVREALNQPPDIVAVSASGATVQLTELNPQFSASWGTMREYSWKDRKGRTWNGGLMVPAGFDPKVRHAVVIQTYGFSPKRFYRDGSNTHEGFTSGFAGRAFLREDILVLALPWTAASGGATDERGQRVTFSEGVLSAIDALAAETWVDRDQIGIMGWSATGDRVLNLLTFTDAPVRAASLLDGDANTLYSMAITYSVMDGVQARKEQANEGGPYGESRERWVRNDPSLHTDCIRAALRIETYGPEVHNNWDIYALLRRQYRPVEMIMFPEGAHALSRPSERMISLQGNVDWYRFWLKGERRTELLIPSETAASLKAQYERWEQMEHLKRAADAKPRCPVL